MKKIETGTQLMPLVSVSTYGGVCDSDHTIDSYSINDDFKEGYIPYNAEMYWDKGFNNELYKKDIIKVATNYIGYIFDEIKKLNLGIKKLVIVDFHSPREYNFETDHLYFDLIVNNNFHKNLLKIINKLSTEDKAKLDSYLREKYSSRDGFNSYTANNLGDLISEIQGEEVRETSVFLYWYFKEFGSDDLKEYLDYDNWSEYFYENKAFYTEFVSDEFLKDCEMNDVDTIDYVHNNYMNKDAETIINELTEQINEVTDLYDNSEYKIERMIKTVNNVFKTIADNTLDLFGK